MTSIADGLTNIYALTNQINTLQAQAKNQAAATASSTKQTAPDPQQIMLALQTNFNNMLMELVASPDNNNNTNSQSDPFSFLLNNNQTAAQIASTGTTANAAAGSTINVNPYTGSVANSNTSDLANQYNILSAQYNLDLSNF